MSEDLLSHLPVRDTEQEWNLDDYEAQTDRFPVLRGGMAIVKIVSGDCEVTPDDGTTEYKSIRLDYPAWNPAFLEATFNLEIIGRVQVGADKVEKVTTQDAGRRISYQRLRTEPRRFDPNEGMPDMMRLLLAVRSEKRNINNDKDWAEALEDAIGKPFKARFRMKATCKTNQLKPNGKNLYVNFPESKLDSDGEITVYKDNGEEVLGEVDSTRGEVEVCRGFPEVMAYIPWEAD